MLPKTYRLTGQKNIERTKKEGKLYQRRFFGVAVYQREDDKPTKFAFVVSSRISKNATQRNRIKRALRESVRYSVTRTKKGYDVVFLTKKIIEKKMTDEIMREVTKTLKALKLLK